MNPLTLDFETYYNTKEGYTLSKMTAEEYIRDPRFQIIGVSVKVGDGRTEWRSNLGNAAVDWLRTLPWSEAVAIAHNMSEFDSLILTHHVGVRPRFYQCTLAMARALHGGNVSKSLANMAKHYGLKAKGDEVMHADGLRLEQFSPAQLARYGAYCCDDTDLCWDLYKILRANLPASELRMQHLLTKMWAEPRLHLDAEAIARYHNQLIANKAALLLRAGVTQEELRSDAKFAAMLEQLGVEPPMKYSPKRKNADGTPKLVYAFAKTDPAMEELLEDPDEEVQILAAARLGVKTTIEESRVARFAGIASRGALPVPLAYGKTHTHRAAGSGKINLQNMGRGKAVTGKTQVGTLVATPYGHEQLQAWRMHTHKGRPRAQIKVHSGVYWADECHCVGLRDMIIAPDGKILVVVDSSNIELRVCHALAGQHDTVAKLHAGADLYCDFATDLYGRPITKEDKSERQHGKVGMLQLQYQAGAGSFRNAARIMGGLRLKAEECEATVKLFRAKFAEVRKFWYKCERAIEDMANGRQGYIDHAGLCRVDHNKIILPNGMPLQYFNLRKEFDPERNQEQWVYDDKEKRHAKKTYGGSVTENLCQALARNVVFDQMLEVEKRWGTYEAHGNGVALTVHDEIVVVVDEDDADECLSFALDAMKQSPKWWPTLPVAAEGDVAFIYGEAK